MKKTLLFLFLVSGFFTAHSQMHISNDTLYTSSGYNIYKGGKVKIGIGTLPSGDFKYIRRNQGSVFKMSRVDGSQAGLNAANALPINQTGFEYNVYKVQRRGNEETGYVFYVVIGTNRITKYEVDVKNAIKAGELVVPPKYAPAKAPKNDSHFSVADELIKLKKLYDEGVITKEEFDAQKKKLMGE